MSIKEMLLVFIICISPIFAGVFVLGFYMLCRCICFAFGRFKESFDIIIKQFLEKR